MQDSVNDLSIMDNLDSMEGAARRKKSDAERVLSVIETIKQEGLKGMGNFIVLALSSEDPRVKSHIAPIYQTKGKAFKILEILLGSCMEERRHTSKYIHIIREKIGGAMRSVFEDIVDFELKEVMQDKDIHRLPSSLNTDAASEFAFSNFHKVFEKKAPFAWSILCGLCGVSHDGTGLPTVDDDDDHDDEEDEGEEEREQEDPAGGDIVRAQDETEKEGPARKRRVTDRYLRATTIFAIIMNSRNFKVNYFQTMVRTTWFGCTARPNIPLNVVITNPRGREVNELACRLLWR